MSFIKKIILPLFTCFIGLFIGLVWKDLPLIKFNPELKVYEVLNLCITFGIGLFIPFLIKKWIDDNRAIKNIISEEIKSTVAGINCIRTKINTCYSSGKIISTDKDEINQLFNDCDLLFNSLNTHLSKSLNLNTEKILKASKENYMSYWKFITGGDLMNSHFEKIDLPFYKEHCKLFKQLEDTVKMISHDVHKA